MATLAIAAITTSMAVPTMKNLVANGQRAAGTNELISTMHAARSIAITRNAQVTICPSSSAMQCDDTPWHEGWIFFVDENQDRQVDANDEILGTVGSIPDITIQSQVFNQFLAFRPNGHIMVHTRAENSGEILLCDARGPEFSHSLIMHVGGKPQLRVDEPPDTYTDCTPA